MKAKLSTIILALGLLLAAFGTWKTCNDTPTVTKVITAALPCDTVWVPHLVTVHDTFTINTSRVRTSAGTYRIPDQPFVSVLAPGYVVDSATYDQLVQRALNGDAPAANPCAQSIMWSDSITESWGSATLSAILADNQVQAWQIDIKPTPCPPTIDRDSLANAVRQIVSDSFRPAKTKQNYAAVGALYQFPTNKSLWALDAGRSWYGAQVIFNQNFSRVEAAGVRFNIKF